MPSPAVSTSVGGGQASCGNSMCGPSPRASPRCAVQAGIRGRQVLAGSEAEGLGQRHDALGLALEFDEHADRRLVDRDDAGRVTELFPILLVAERD